MDGETPSQNKTVKRERKANFADKEVRVLIELYQQNRSKLVGKFSNILTQRQKIELWQEILEFGQPGNFLPMMLSATRQPRERV